MSNLQAEQEIVIRYLLGDVTDEEHDRIGEKSVVNLEYGEFVEQVELELIDSYVRGRLNQNQRRLFEQNFLVTPERRDRVLAFSAILSAGLRRSKEQGANEQTAGAKELEHKRRFSFPSFFWNRPLLGVFATAVCVLFMAVQFWLVRDWWRKRDAPLIAMGELKPVLPVPTVRGGENVSELQVRPQLKYVALLLAVTDENSKYVVEIQASGKALWRLERAMPAALDGQTVLSVLIPTAILKDGQEYVVAWQSVAALSTSHPNMARYRVKYLR